MSCYDNVANINEVMEWSLEEFSIQPLLWHLIEEMVCEPERPDIKVVIGEGLIDENIELFEEAVSLLQIWQDYRDETDKEEKNIALNQHLSKLPEPPMMRENLKKEVKMFVELLQQKAYDSGRKVSNILSEKDSSIVEYVMDEQMLLPMNTRPASATSRSSASSSRPSTARSSSDGRQTPMRATPKSDGSSYASSMSDHLESMNENLNALEIDRIAEHLREMLTQERSRLKDDINFLQECLFEESDYRQQVLSSPDPEPSLKDLRDLGTKLEKELLNSNTPITNVTPRFPDKKLSNSRQNSVHENHLESKPKAVPPNKPTVPRPPVSPPERQHKGSKPSRSFRVSSGSSVMNPSPPGTGKLIPSPPNSAKTQRPSSAARFRRLVVEWRDSSQ